MDTPVVVIGQSMIFKVGAKDPKVVWHKISERQEYDAVSEDPVREIVIKTSAEPDHDDHHRGDDVDKATDKHGFSVPAGTSFHIDVFTVGSGTKPAASISSTDGKSIRLKNLISGSTLHPKSERRLHYSSDGSGTDSQVFAKVEVQIGGQPKVPIRCRVDPTPSNPNPSHGKCRIVLRASP
jgi:hypothetical protein